MFSVLIINIVLSIFSLLSFSLIFNYFIYFLNIELNQYAFNFKKHVNLINLLNKFDFWRLFYKYICKRFRIFNTTEFWLTFYSYRVEILIIGIIILVTANILILLFNMIQLFIL
jgi:hypothetical protein